MKAWRVILAVVVIFAAGVVTGGLLVRSTTKQAANPPMPMPGGPPGTGMWSQSRVQFVMRMHRQLDLTPEQCKQVDAIMKVGHQHMAKLWEPIAPEAQEETKSVRLQIQAILTPEQLVKFEEVFKPRKKPENWKPENWKENRDRKDRERSETNAVGVKFDENDAEKLKECWQD